ncbi:MAG: hypothetical protein VXX89_05530 [Pseudomonadota bacterium]|nr:hypothetical protein [Pseudomonadota bacterium]
MYRPFQQQALVNISTLNSWWMVFSKAWAANLRGPWQLRGIVVCGLIFALSSGPTRASNGTERGTASSTVQKLDYAQEQKPTRVLFIGNSYFYYNDSLHNHVRRIVDELEPVDPDALTYKSATIGGAQLSHHPISWHLAANNIGVKEPFDAVILQGGSAEVLTPKREKAFQRTVDPFSELIRQAGGEPYLYMTHAYVAPHPRVAPGQIRQIEAAYVSAGNRNKAQVIPVGKAFDRAHQALPGVILHKPFDGSHPSLNGTYLAALVVYLTLYGGSLENLKYDYFGKVEAETARELRRIAEEVVAEFRRPAPN